MDPRLLESLKEVYKFVGVANYKRALSLAGIALKKFPDSIEAEQTYATILADAADYLRPKKARLMKRDAVQRLEALTRRLRGKSVEMNGAIRNEYFYHSRQFKKQFELGVELVKAGDKTSYFSQGVGAAWYACELKRRGQRRRAEAWANRSISAWNRYLKIEPRYYNSYVHLALAYGILGEWKLMENSLSRAAALSKKPSRYFEFERIRVLTSSFGEGDH